MDNLVFTTGVHTGKTYRDVRINHTGYFIFLASQPACKMGNFINFIAYCMRYLRAEEDTPVTQASAPVSHPNVSAPLGRPERKWGDARVAHPDVPPERSDEIDSDEINSDGRRRTRRRTRRGLLRGLPRELVGGAFARSGGARPENLRHELSEDGQRLGQRRTRRDIYGNQLF
jgi:hypothetical protein